MVGGFDGLVAGLDEFVDLFLGVAAGFREEDLDALDGGGFDLLVAVVVVGVGDFTLKIRKNRLGSGQEFLGAGDFGSVELFHNTIIA